MKDVQTKQDALQWVLKWERRILIKRMLESCWTQIKINTLKVS